MQKVILGNRIIKVYAGLAEQEAKVNDKVDDALDKALDLLKKEQKKAGGSFKVTESSREVDAVMDPMLMNYIMAAIFLGGPVAMVADLAYSLLSGNPGIGMKLITVIEDTKDAIGYLKGQESTLKLIEDNLSSIGISDKGIKEALNMFKVKALGGSALQALIPKIKSKILNGSLEKELQKWGKKEGLTLRPKDIKDLQDMARTYNFKSTVEDIKSGKK